MADERFKAMTTAYDELKKGVADQPRARLDTQAKQQAWDWRILGAIAGLSGGIIAALIGSLLTASAWLTGTGGIGSYVQTLGTIFLLMTIPLLIFGAHCLDLKERQKDRERRARLDEKR